MNIASLMVLEWLLTFLVHYVELVGFHGVSCGGTMEVYRGRGFEMFLDSVT